MLWDWQFAFSILPQILAALKITISATFAGFLLALILGMLFMFLSRSRVQPVSVVVKWLVQFIRNTPLLVQLYFVFYVFPELGVSLSPFTAGVIGLGIHYSTYLSEVFRSGIDAVPKGQWEACRALNFTRSQTWWKIIIPQGIPPVIPVIGNYLISMFKDTPLLSAITLVEILQTAKIIGSGTFRYLESFTIVGVLFFLLSYPASKLVKYMENRWNPRY
jgi:polar amino acid transport system permease protein